jgi:hypothetical protein
MPTLPLWIGEERCLPVDLEQSHNDARRRLRMPVDDPPPRRRAAGS